MLDLRLKRDGPVRFCKVILAWIILAVALILIAGSVGGRQVDLTKFGAGIGLALLPFVLKTIVGLHFYDPLGSFVHSTYFFLFPSAEGLSLGWDVEILFGRASILIGFLALFLGLG